MGIQIYIAAKDMIAAGWKQAVETDYFINEDGDEESFETYYWEKGGVEIGSYCALDFVADCNNWGSNKARFEKLGLFHLPHILS